MRTAALLLLALLPLQLAAQTPRVVLRGRGDPALDAHIRQLLRDPGRRLWTADTLIARNDTVREPLLVVGGTVRLEGVLAGDVAAVGADFFIRPGAHVLGNVENIAGGWYASDLAVLGGRLEDRSDAPYAVEHNPDGLVIRGTRSPRLLAFRPLAPGYDRVDGFSPGAGARLLLPPAGRLEPTVEVWGSYRTERGQLDGGAAARLSRGWTDFQAGAERTTLTNEDWIRGTIQNALSYLWDGNDIRDYYEAERIWAELRRGLERGERSTDVWLRAQVEDARSLRADRPWTIFDADSLRPNRPVEAGRVSSISAGTSVSWRRPTFATALGASAEFATDVLGGDFTFNAYRLDLDWAMLALANHTLQIDAHAQGPLPFGAEDSVHRLPRQRWSHLGGSGTLPTFSDAGLQGDRVVFIESRYGIPLGARARLPLLGIPTLELLHATGMAWTRAERRSFVQNVGLRLRYNLLYLRVMSNPEDLDGDVEFSVGVTFPQRAFPWQPAGGFF